MTQAVVGVHDGFAFQARRFWLEATRLLGPQQGVISVGVEEGPKGFDDIWVEYAPGRAQDGHGRPLIREHIQCKWHGTQNGYGFAQLADPDFIHAKSHSLLQRALNAQRKHAPGGEGVRFRLASNGFLLPDDPLKQLYRTRSGHLDTSLLAMGKSARHKMGRVRKLWGTHLGVDDDDLLRFAGTLALTHDVRTLEELKDALNERFIQVGILPSGAGQSGFVYDDLVFKWVGQGRNRFDRATLLNALGQERLLGQAKPAPEAFGVKSFEHRDRLEDRCMDVLDLVPSFDQRFIRSDEDWSTVLYPALRDFLENVSRNRPHLRLVLDAHATLAFAAGSVLDVKSGRAVELEQRGRDREIWTAEETTTDPAWPTLTVQTITLAAGKPDLAFAVSLTHDIARDVRAYVEAALPSVGRLSLCTVSTGPGRSAVRGGSHAVTLADALTDSIRALHSPGLPAITHLFFAAPNGFTFFAGQRRQAMGPVTLYEFDFGRERTGSYTPSLSLPIKPVPAGR